MTSLNLQFDILNSCVYRCFRVRDSSGLFELLFVVRFGNKKSERGKPDRLVFYGAIAE